ncbi:hypothetical protein [Bradyrhizobium vignae]|uniref:hypothetical protein n=1 Tax=Bradyrhizobium vignae TaxID=1549949 RepID=UPI0013E8F275|nr:hypothetical protein [Bradyrhizobium vignae]
MCERCAKLDEKIEHCRAIASRITDQFTGVALENLVLQYEAEKLALHPKPDTSGE